MNKERPTSDTLKSVAQEMVEQWDYSVHTLIVYPDGSRSMGWVCSSCLAILDNDDSHRDDCVFLRLQRALEEEEDEELLNAPGFIEACERIAKCVANTKFDLSKVKTVKYLPGLQLTPDTLRSIAVEIIVNPPTEPGSEFNSTDECYYCRDVGSRHKEDCLIARLQRVLGEKT